MGQLEQFAQRTFAEETLRITKGAAGWKDPSEIRLEKVTSDGFLAIRAPRALVNLAAPWPEAQHHDEVMVELKLPGNHLDREPIERALLRRQARQIQRLAEEDASWLGEEPLWLAASHVPEWLHAARAPVRFAPGCYWIEPQWRRFLWIAANELPLLDELIPFLLVRSGQALDEFARWVAPRRSPEWVLSMLTYLPMTTLTREDLLWRFGKVDDPEIQARQRHVLDVLLEVTPGAKQQLVEQGLEQGLEQGREQGREQGLAQGRLAEARAMLRRVLLRRQLAPSQADDARIEACSDLATLERWFDRALTAGSAADALA